MANDMQQKLHNVIQEVVEEYEDGVVTGWILIYEAVRADGPAHAGHFYGPHEMTTWRALGLVEWAKFKTLLNDEPE